MNKNSEYKKLITICCIYEAVAFLTLYTHDFCDLWLYPCGLQYIILCVIIPIFAILLWGWKDSVLKTYVKYSNIIIIFFLCISLGLYLFFRPVILNFSDIAVCNTLEKTTEELCVERLLPLKTHKFIKEQAEEIAADEEGTSKATQEMKAGIKHVHSINSYEMEAISHGDDYIPFYPSFKVVLEKLVHNHFTAFCYGALVECSASEENARMMAMQTATDNAEEILHDLSIEYNRVRQAQITQEITEVIGGAKALKKKKEKKKLQNK